MIGMPVGAITLTPKNLPSLHFQPKTYQALYTEMKVRDETFQFVTEYTYLGLMNFAIPSRVCCWEQTKQTRPYGLCPQQVPLKVHRKLYDSGSPCVWLWRPGTYCLIIAQQETCQKQNLQISLGVGRKHTLATVTATRDRCWMPTRHKLWSQRAPRSGFLLPVQM